MPWMCESCESRPQSRVVRLDGINFRVCYDCDPRPEEQRVKSTHVGGCNDRCRGDEHYLLGDH